MVSRPVDSECCGAASRHKAVDCEVSSFIFVHDGARANDLILGGRPCRACDDRSRLAVVGDVVRICGRSGGHNWADSWYWSSVRWYSRYLPAVWNCWIRGSMVYTRVCVWRGVARYSVIRAYVDWCWVWLLRASCRPT